MEQASVDQLRAIGLFGALPDEALSFVCGSTAPQFLSPGQCVYRENELGSTLYAVLQGELEVLRTSRGGHEVRLAVLGIHDWFGEMGFVDMMPRSATVRAIAPCVLLPVPAALLASLYRRDLKAYTLLVLNIARELSRRLRVADALVVDALATGLDRGRPSFEPPPSEPPPPDSDPSPPSESSPEPPSADPH